ncbi:zinc finger BED domain-containing protein RICESLEEPER 2 [Tanacetum coccineum]
MQVLSSFLLEVSQHDVEESYNSSAFESIKGAGRIKPEAGQKSDGTRWANFHDNPDYLREQYRGLVIHRGLPVNHFRPQQTNEGFQNTIYQDTLITQSTSGWGSSWGMRSVILMLRLSSTPKYFASYDVLWVCGHQVKSDFLVLSRMAMDILSVQASSVASESAFSTSGRLLTIRRTRLTPESLEMCACSEENT